MKSFILMVAPAVIGGFVARLRYCRWWSWLVAAAGISFTSYQFANVFFYQTENSIFWAAVCAGIGAIIPDLGYSLRNKLRQPQTISFVLAILAIGGVVWLGKNVKVNQESAGALAVTIIGLWLLARKIFRKKKQK